MDNYWFAEKKNIKLVKIKKRSEAKHFFGTFIRYNDPTFYEKKSHFTVHLNPEYYLIY